MELLAFTLAVFMPLEGNPYVVPHLKALISGIKIWDGQRFGSTLSLLNPLLKISILLHKMASVRFDLTETVSVFSIFLKENNFKNLTAVLRINQSEAIL